MASCQDAIAARFGNVATQGQVARGALSLENALFTLQAVSGVWGLSTGRVNFASSGLLEGDQTPRPRATEHVPARVRACGAASRCGLLVVRTRATSEVHYL